MKKLILCSLTLGCAWVFASCSRMESPQTLEELTRNSREVSKRTLPVDVMLGDPYQLQYLDGYLLWVDKVKEKLLTVYDLRDERIVVQLVNEGKGPNEILHHPLQLVVDPVAKTVGMLQRQTDHYDEYRFGDILRDSLVLVNRFKFEPSADMCYKLDDGMFLFADMFSDTVASAAVCDATGKMIRKLNTFPAEILEIGDPDDRYIQGQSNMCYNSKHKILFLAYTFIDKVQCFDIGQPVLVLRKEIGLSEIDKKRQRSYARQVASSDDYIYLLRSEPLTKECYILKFDTQGNPLDCIHVDKTTSRFCVTPDDQKIYALQKDSDLMPVIAEYQLR